MERAVIAAMVLAGVVASGCGKKEDYAADTTLADTVNASSTPAATMAPDTATTTTTAASKPTKTTTPKKKAPTTRY